MTPLELLEQHQHVARRVARGYFAPGMDRDDLEQEALIGVWEAAVAWDPGRQSGEVSFEAFAGMVARRRVMSAVTAARREKHLPLNGSVRESIAVEGEDIPLFETIAGPCPFARLEHRDQVRGVVARARRLSPLERRALLVVVNGENYSGDKTIDNASQRAKRKLREAIAA